MNKLENECFTVSDLCEELVFVESNAFLIHFAKSYQPEIQILTNTACDSAMAAELESSLLEEATRREIEPVKGGKFTLSQKK